MGELLFLRPQFGASLGEDRPMIGARPAGEPAFVQSIPDLPAYRRFLTVVGDEYHANLQGLPSPGGNRGPMGPAARPLVLPVAAERYGHGRSRSPFG